MLKRIITALVLAVLGVPATIAGGVFFWLFMATFVTIAAWEYTVLMRGAKFEPQQIFMVSSVLFLFFIRTYYPAYSEAALTGLVLLAMTLHLIAFERGRDRAAGDFAITVTGIVYLGWLGSYLVKLREIPGGLYWFFLVLPAVWFTDSGAYLVGKQIGTHQLSPRLSPKKTWEGYFGGIVFGVLGGILFAWLWRDQIPVSLQSGAVIGLFMASLTTLGDLGESMIKRQAGMKDSSHILPGHGGVFDRIDTWLWASALGYYLVSWFFL